MEHRFDNGADRANIVDHAVLLNSLANHNSEICRVQVLVNGHSSPCCRLMLKEMKGAR